MSKFAGAVCLLLFSVFISSVSQILLKKAANKTYKDHIREYINPLVIFAYGMFWFGDSDYVVTEEYTPVHAANPGIGRVYFCDGYGIFIPGREDRKEKVCRDWTDHAGDSDFFPVDIIS